MSKIAAVRGTGLALAATLAACAAAPTQYYTLMPPPVAPAVPSAPYRIEVQAVDLPQQVATQQLVVRTGAGEMVPVDTRRWIAPLADELRDALSANLSRRLGALDVYGLAGAAAPQGPPLWRISLKVQRFESALGAAARIDAVWTLRRGDAALTCASSVSESVGPGYEALAAGHQQAVAELAERIAAAISAAGANGVASCPQL